MLFIIYLGSNVKHWRPKRYIVPLSQFDDVVREDGSLPACIFEKSTLAPSTDYIVDYDALFSAIVLDNVLVLAEVLPTDVARTALLNTIAHPDAVKPLTPYLWHHVCDALVTVGCFEKCTEIISDYWGGMIQAGADTFWECYDPKDPRASPYGDVRNNSFCHAWSCTPTYLLRGKLLDAAGGKVTGKVTMGQLDEQWIQRSIS
ncbi:hypothetical protein QQX98_003955 [Neonectria punicea]|uniref:Alpha-L-rhamnosidase six-hairpin glycosidase domain-containing protein n=1 Tax=Neonectria punicea TaxID=979145 RepID=A0ABR1HBC1_9HYPO